MKTADELRAALTAASRAARGVCCDCEKCERSRVASFRLALTLAQREPGAVLHGQRYVSGKTLDALDAIAAELVGKAGK